MCVLITRLRHCSPASLVSLFFQTHHAQRKSLRSVSKLEVLTGLTATTVALRSLWGRQRHLKLYAGMVGGHRGTLAPRRDGIDSNRTTALPFFLRC